MFVFCLTSELCCLVFWWNCPRTARKTELVHLDIFYACKSEPACCYLPWSCLFVVSRRSHRLWASVWGAAGGDHLPRGITGGKNHHELQGPGQSTCYIQVTYVPHKPALITTRWAFCVSPIACHLSGCIHAGLGSACKLQGHSDAYPNLDAPPGVYNVCDRPAVHDCVIYCQAFPG